MTYGVNFCIRCRVHFGLRHNLNAAVIVTEALQPCSSPVGAEDTVFGAVDTAVETTAFGAVDIAFGALAQWRNAELCGLGGNRMVL